MKNNISPSAYLLRKQWEQEDRKLFRKFKKQEGVIEVINALAEMMIKIKASEKPQNLAHF